jgi:hypothetical protein
MLSQCLHWPREGAHLVKINSSPIFSVPYFLVLLRLTRCC